MPFTHSFAAIRPPARYDEPTVAWSHIGIEEGATAQGPWTQIEERPIVADPTPNSPNPIDLTVMSSVEDGWYRFRFRDASNVFSEYSVPVQNPSDVVGISGYRPALSDLGAIMRARTRTDSSVELGTFTTDTRPTAIEADAMISQALDVVSTQLGNVPRRLAGLASALVALRAAMYVETSFYPEDTNSDQSAYQRYREMYDDALASYTTAYEGGRQVDRPGAGLFSLRIGTFYTAPRDPTDLLGYYDPFAEQIP